VDLVALSEMTGGDAEFAADIIGSYLDSSRELYVQIRACLACEDRRQLARLVHQLAGPVPTFTPLRCVSCVCTWRRRRLQALPLSWRIVCPGSVPS
jgi:hypothetical protein